MKNVLKKIADCLEGISAVILLFMLIQVLLQVLFRKVLKISVPWTEEFARMGYIWLVFLMLPVLESRNDQLKVTYFFDKIPYKARAVLYWVMSAAYVVILAFIIAGAFRYYGQTKTMTFGSVRWLLVCYQYIPAVIGPAFAIVFIINRMVNYKEFLKQAEDEYIVDIEEEEAA